jgi:phosphatidylserine/phosphatidylglycerophosphate/cardiolipin synthase-like enzyme
LSAVRRSLRSRQRRNQSIPKSAEIGATRYSKTSNAFAFRAYGLATGLGIVEALVRAKERGVDVRLIADKTTPCERESGIEPLAAAGVPIWIDAQARIAHAKTMVIDGAVTLMGSVNWTRNAAVNSEDLNLISSRAVAAAYAGHWRDRLAVSSPFNRREDWCRVGSVT